MSIQDVESILNDSKKNLNQKLKFTEKIFSTPDLNTVIKKENVLNWYKEIIAEDDTNCDVYNSLRICVYHFKDTLRYPQITESILQIINEINNVANPVYELILEILSNKSFQRYFVHNLSKFAQIVELLALKTKDEDLLDDDVLGKRICETTINCVFILKRDTLMQYELKDIFIDSLLKCLMQLTMMLKYDNEKDNEYVTSIENCIQEMIFHNHATRRDIVESWSRDRDNNILKKLLSKIDDINSSKESSGYIVILLRSFCNSCEDENMKFQFLIQICDYIKLYDVNKKEVKKLTKRNTVILNDIVNDVIGEGYIRNSSNYKNELTLTEWMKLLTDNLLDTMNEKLTILRLKLYKNIVKGNHVIMEETIKKFVINVMIKKKDKSMMKEYEEICLIILNTFIKLNRMHKLISNILIEFKNNCDSTMTGNINKFDILTEGFFKRMRKAVTNLPSTVQSLAFFNTLLYHLEIDCVKILMQDKKIDENTNIIPIIDLISYLLCNFISGSKITDHTVTDVVKEKFIHLINNLANQLTSFGNAIINKQHVCSIMRSYLKLCLVWGDMQLLLISFENSRRRVPTLTGPLSRSPTNLSLLHSYLSDYHWQLIAQRVANFGDVTCDNLMSDLVLQKMHALSKLEDEVDGPYLDIPGSEEPSAVCANYLATHSNHKWLFKNVTSFVDLLTPFYVLTTSKNLVKYLQTNQDELDDIMNTRFKDSRGLILAMNCYVFHTLGKKLSKIGLKDMKGSLNMVDYEEILKVEMNINSEDEDNNNELTINAVKEQVDKIAIMISSNNNEARMTKVTLLQDNLKTEFEILRRLPVEYLNLESKSVLCTLAFVLLKSCLIYVIDNKSHHYLIVDLIKYIADMVEQVKLPKYLNIGKILFPIYEIKSDNKKEILQQLDQLMLKNVLIEKSFLNTLKESFDSHGRTFDESAIETIHYAASAMLKKSRVSKRKRSNNEDDGNVKRKYFKTFENGLKYAFEKEINNESIFACYILLLKETLETKKDQLPFLMRYLPAFVTCFENVDYEGSNLSCDFLQVIMGNFKDFRSALPDKFLIDTWSSHLFNFDSDLITKYQHASTVYEYNDMLNIVLVYTENGLFTENVMEEDTEILWKLWKCVIETPVKIKKADLRKGVIKNLCSNLQIKLYNLKNEQFKGAPDYSVKFVLKLFSVIVRTNKMPQDVTDICLELASMEGITNDDILMECVELIFLLLASNPVIILDRIASYLLVYKHLLRLVVSSSNNAGFFTYCAAHKLQKLTDMLVKYKKELTKLAIYTLGDLIKIMETPNLNAEIKLHMRNIIYSWISICDNHGFNYLSSSLTAASQELYKQYRSEYERDKYIGKV